MFRLNVPPTIYFQSDGINDARIIFDSNILMWKRDFDEPFFNNERKTLANSTQKNKNRLDLINHIENDSEKYEEISKLKKKLNKFRFLFAVPLIFFVLAVVFLFIK